MNKENNLSEKWIKASILGTIWAASEIVIGSFLHNLKVPFSGNILTSIGLIILISISYKWKEKGLFWRAGLICALMKTMSPSAVIFGPMIAIISESFLLEISVRLLGKTIAGYILGSVLAMSWNLLQQISNYIIFYGYNIVEIYTRLLQLSQKQLNISFNILWLPIIFLLIVHILFGIVSSFLGMKTGKKLLTQPSMSKIENISNNNLKLKNKDHSDFNYSLYWLLVNLFLVICSLIILSRSDWIIWSILITGIIFIWSLRYKRTLHQLSRPKFWFLFFLLTMLSAFIFSELQSGGTSWYNGLLIGLQMNFRAAIIITGFSVLGTELYNPKIRKIFLKTSFKQLPLALELSFESLPSVIAAFPEFKSIIKNPVAVFYQIVSQAELRLDDLRNKNNFHQKVFILTGAKGEGKTTKLKKILEVLKQNNISVNGIYSPKIIENENKIGYDIFDISSGKREPFLRQHCNESYDKIGKFYIYPQGLQLGKTALKLSNHTNNQIIIIDEVGNLELDNNGWADCLKNLTENPVNHLLLIVRDSFIDKILQKWNFKEKYIYNISDMNYWTISHSIIEHVT